MRSSSHGWSLVWVALATAGANAGFQPVFRSAVELVTVDATVLSGDGTPIHGLGPDDFVLRVDGTVRPIVTAQFVAARLSPTAAPPLPLAARHYTTNQDDEAGRLIVLAVDESHIRRLEGRSAMQAAATFVDSLDPLDRLAVTALTRDGVLQFTRDRVDARRRLEAITGQTDPVFLQFNVGLLEATEIADGGRTRLADVVMRECGRSLATYLNPARAIEDGGASRDACPEQVEQEARAVAQHARTQARISLSALEGLVDSLRELDGPKTVVLLSEGLVLDPRLVDLTELASRALAARVAIYGLQMEIPLFEASQDRVSPTFLRDVQIRGDGLARLAGATRGGVFRLNGSDPEPFRRIARELSGHYLIAFEAIDGDRDGRAHRVQVSLKRGGGLLRAREAFTLPRAVTPARTLEQELVALLRSSRPATELPVHVTTYTYAEPDSDRLRVVVSTEADGAAGAAQVRLGYVLTDATGVIAASGAHAVEHGRHAFSAVVPSGRYTLRVAAIDPLRRKGLVERPFVAATQSAGPLRISSLMLAPAATGGGALHPIVDRVSDRRVTAYLELYAGDGRQPPNLGITFEVLDDAARAPLTTLDAGPLRADGPLAVARTDVDLVTLRAGRYLARATVAVDGKSVAHVVRPFTYAPR